VTNLDCDQTSFCSLCVAGQCGAGCSQPCNNNTQCIQAGCNYCKTLGGTTGLCSTAPATTCGGHCGTDLDCDATPGRCNQCYFNQCYSTCKNACEFDSDCITQGCSSCVNKTCNYSN